MSTVEIHPIQTTINGRVLVQASAAEEPRPLLVGFHGYGETADSQMEKMQQIPGIEGWICVSIQALHSFYNRKGQPGFSWLTSQDRELRIKENTNYVNNVFSQLIRNFRLSNTLVFCGFSQGTSMACRAAVLGAHQPRGVMLLGGDIPPDVDDLRRLNRVLIGRGTEDNFYTEQVCQIDLARIEQANIPVSICTFHGGHVWSKEYLRSAGNFLRECRAR